MPIGSCTSYCIITNYAKTGKNISHPTLDASHKTTSLKNLNWSLVHIWHTWKRPSWKPNGPIYRGDVPRLQAIDYKDAHQETTRSGSPACSERRAMEWCNFCEHHWELLCAREMPWSGFRWGYQVQCGSVSVWHRSESSCDEHSLSRGKLGGGNCAKGRRSSRGVECIIEGWVGPEKSRREIGAGGGRPGAWEPNRHLGPACNFPWCYQMFQHRSLQL